MVTAEVTERQAQWRRDNALTRTGALWRVLDHALARQSDFDIGSQASIIYGAPMAALPFLRSIIGSSSAA